MKLFALVHLKPDLPDIIEAECAVYVSGFHPGSSELALDSNEGDLSRARMRLLGELDAIFVHKKRFSLKSNLAHSAQRFVENHKAQVVMCIHEVGGLGLASAKSTSSASTDELQVTLCGKPRETVNYIRRNLCAKPLCETVKMNASQFAALGSSDENSVECLQQEYGIALSYNPEECQVTIEGYNEGDVTAVSRILHSSEQTACKTQALDCSREESTYLSYVLLKSPTEDGEELLTALQADCDTTVKGKGSRILLVGPASSLDSAAKRIKESSLLQGLQKKSFHYNRCNSALLPDLKSKVQSLEDSRKVVVVMSSRQQEDKRVSIVDVTLLGTSAESFEAACQEVEVLIACTTYVCSCMCVVCVCMRVRVCTCACVHACVCSRDFVCDIRTICENGCQSPCISDLPLSVTILQHTVWHTISVCYVFSSFILCRV